MMIAKEKLHKLYVTEKRSVNWIAKLLDCSENKVTYWLQKHNIKKRSISDALYLKHNPKGDPFAFRVPHENKSWFLFGLGLGLYWGEGNKMNRNTVRIGNSDPHLLRIFLRFLKDIYSVQETKLRFGLQIFNDISKKEALAYWADILQIPEKQFYKVIVTKSVRRGTYGKRSRYGVLTIYFSNTKLRDTIMSAIERLQKANVAQLVEHIHGESQRLLPRNSETNFENPE